MGPLLGASPPMRMAASWFGSSSTLEHPPNTRLWRDDRPPKAGSAQIVLSAQPSVDRPTPPDLWLSIGAGLSTDRPIERLRPWKEYDVAK